MKKIKVTRKQIEVLAESELAILKKNEAEKALGDIGNEEDRDFTYLTKDELENVKNSEINSHDDNGDTIDPKDMKTPPHELLEYLEKIEDAKSILSKVAAKEDNENIKNRIYAHYEKAQKLAFELIKEFGIIH